jgi:succinyl-CoA synthetase beta subunit
MKIHEYQAKQIFQKHGIRTPHGVVIQDAGEIESKINSLDTPIYVVKAQIHAGGRGKGGGVKLAKTAGEAAELAHSILGMNLITHQTGPEGKTVNTVYVETGVDIARELYLGMVLDRDTSSVAIMMSTEGGTEIEEVAEATPEKIVKEFVDPRVGLQGFQCRNLAKALGLTGSSVRELSKLLYALYGIFNQYDCSLLEVNPLVVTGAGELVVLDGKVTFDDNAMFRQKGILEFRDLTEEEPSEIEAGKFGLSYIKLDGDIGCLVNGAGLAMATMDIVKQVGQEPANFLDVGGSATTEKVTEAFRIILADNVKAIFVNIFGGIMKCDTIANGVIAAAKEVGIDVPLVVRLEGTNVDLGKELLANSGLPIISATTMLDGAEKVASAVGEA